MAGDADSATYRWRLFAAAIALISVAAFVVVVVLARDVLILAFFSVLIAIILSYPVDWFSRMMPRGPALLLTLLLLCGAIAGAGWAAAARVSEQAENVSSQLPKAWEKAQGWVRHYVRPAASGNAASANAAMEKAPEMAGQAVQTAISKVVPAAIGAVSSLLAAVLALALAAFFVHQPRAFPKGIKIMLPSSAHAEFDELYHEVGARLRGWLGGVLISMTIMGSLTMIGLLVAGIDAWLFLGLLTFVGTFIPYAGALASAIPGLLFALAQSRQHFLYAIVVYLGVHVIEGYVVEPLIMRRAVQINPALLLIWAASMGAVLGIPGVMVATPLLVCVQAVVLHRSGAGAGRKRPASSARARAA